MIAVFKPIDNWYWFDLREFEIKEDGNPWRFKWLSIEWNKHLLSEAQTFKPLSKCSNREEFRNQFSVLL